MTKSVELKCAAYVKDKKIEDLYPKTGQPLDSLYYC